MDVVNGKIVPARTERSKSDTWRALQPSGIHLRPGVGPTSSAGMNPGPARRSFGEQDHHQPWGRSSSASLSSDPEFSHESTCEEKMQSHLETGGVPKTRRTRSFEAPEGSDTAVDARERRGVEQSTVDHRETETDGKKTPTVGAATSVAIAGRMAACVLPTPTFHQPILPAVFVVSDLLRGDRAVILLDGITWIAPLRFLLRKELTASDVGALGRIILPKKDAEGQLPLLETNAKYLEMVDYTFSRRWLFQYKCWINNKSRMYVLENTGEFVRYHGLKAHDNFIVYEDIRGNLVARGQKK